MKAISIVLFSLFFGTSSHCSEKVSSELAREKQKIEKRSHEIERSKEIHFSTHAKDQMDKRGISRGEVEKAIEYGTKSVNKNDKSVRFIRKNIMVIMDLTEKTVITVYRSNKAENDILSPKQRSLKIKKEKDKKRSPSHGLTKETKSFIRTLNP